MCSEDGYGLARLHEQGLVVVEALQRADDGPEALPVAGRLARPAVDDEVFRALGHLGVEVVHEHAQGRLLVPALAGKIPPPRRPDGGSFSGIGHGISSPKKFGFSLAPGLPKVQRGGVVCCETTEVPLDAFSCPSRSGPVTLTGDDLSIEDVVRVARRGARVEVSATALDRVRRARDVVDRVLERGDLVYGMNTGVGSLSRYRIPFENLEQFSVRLVTRHTTHQGAELHTERRAGDDGHAGERHGQGRRGGEGRADTGLPRRLERRSPSRGSDRGLRGTGRPRRDGGDRAGPDRARRGRLTRAAECPAPKR